MSWAVIKSRKEFHTTYYQIALRWVFNLIYTFSLRYGQNSECHDKKREKGKDAPAEWQLCCLIEAWYFRIKLR